MKRTVLSIIMLIAGLYSGWCQEGKDWIIGKILDAKTKMPLSGATVEVPMHRIELISNDDGEFRFSAGRAVPDDSVRVSHLGYKTWVKPLSELREQGIVLLEEHSIELQMVIINSRDLPIRDVDRAMRQVRGTLYAANTETTNGMYNLFLSYLKEYNVELHAVCNYDLSSVSSEHLALFEEYVKPFKGRPNKRDTTVKDYNDFPVVNISHQGAVLFCQWLTEQYNAYPGRKQFSKVRFRLPTLKEWQIAALGYPKFQTWNVEDNIVDVLVPADSLEMMPDKGERRSIKVGTDILYPWFGSFYYRRSPQNHRGCFLGNFKVVDPGRPCYIKRPGYDGWTMMARTANYFPNDMGLFDVVGNVAEMIDEEGKACGGSWNDAPIQCTIHSVKTYKKPGASIGFRVFMDVLEP